MSTPTIPPLAPTTCDYHGPDCIFRCICPSCGVNRRELRWDAAAGRRLTAAQTRCWMGKCGR